MHKQTSITQNEKLTRMKEAAQTATTADTATLHYQLPLSYLCNVISTLNNTPALSLLCPLFHF